MREFQVWISRTSIWTTERSASGVSMTRYSPRFFFSSISTRGTADGAHTFECFMKRHSPASPAGQWTSVSGRPATCGSIADATAS